MVGLLRKEGGSIGIQGFLKSTPYLLLGLRKRFVIPISYSSWHGLARVPIVGFLGDCLALVLSVSLESII